MEPWPSGLAFSRPVCSSIYASQPEIARHWNVFGVRLWFFACGFADDNCLKRQVSTEITSPDIGKPPNSVISGYWPFPRRTDIRNLTGEKSQRSLTCDGPSQPLLKPGLPSDMGIFTTSSDNQTLVNWPWPGMAGLKPGMILKGIQSRLCQRPRIIYLPAAPGSTYTISTASTYKPVVPGVHPGQRSSGLCYFESKSVGFTLQIR